MDERSASARLMGALTPYFSSVTAEALFSVSLRRASVGRGELGHASLPTVVSVIERALPAYLADQTRRAECVQGLRRLLEPDGRSKWRAASDPRADGGQAVAAPVTVQVRRPEDVTSVCDSGREVARRVGFSLVEQTKIATAISELSRNILCYATTGSVKIGPLEAPRRGIEIFAVDRGPGIRDVAEVMSDRYRSRTGMGMGLKGVKRLMDEFEIWSKPGVGTTVTTRRFVP